MPKELNHGKIGQDDPHARQRRAPAFDAFAGLAAPDPSPQPAVPPDAPVTQPKASQPARPAREARTSHMNLAFTPAEHDRIREMAEYNSMSIRAYARRAILKQLRLDEQAES